MKKKYNVFLYVIVGDKNYLKFFLKVYKKGIYLQVVIELVYVDYKYKKVVSFFLKDFVFFN